VPLGRAKWGSNEFRADDRQPTSAAFLALEVSHFGSEKSDAFIQQAEELTKDLRYAPEAKIVIDRAKRWNVAAKHRQAEPERRL
jgi:hypothetical protein